MHASASHQAPRAANGGASRLRTPHRAPASGAAAAAAAYGAAPLRSVVILPGLGNNAKDYAQMASELHSRGLHVEVAPVTRLDWARNAAGLRYADYWRGTLAPLPTVRWYLERVSSAARAAAEATGGARATLLAHSAGGWLGRVWLLRERGAGAEEAQLVDCYVSLGSPQLPPPPGVVDQYATVAGRYIQGAPLLGPGSWKQRVVGAGYKQASLGGGGGGGGGGEGGVCGDATAWGDGVVPVPTAHLPEAHNFTLEGVYHSPLGADEGGRTLDSLALSSDDGEAAFVAAAEAAVVRAPPAEGRRLWYGSAGVLEQWADLLDPSLLAAAAAAAAPL
eukprot:scaffold24.g2922.t1